MDQFRLEHPEYSRGLLTFVMEFIVANKWPGNVLMRLYNDCDTECTVGQTEPCGCTCTIDPFEMGDDEVRKAGFVMAYVWTCICILVYQDMGRIWDLNKVNLTSSIMLPYAGPGVHASFHDGSSPEVWR